VVQFEAALKGHGFNGCGKIQVFDLVLKGRGFEPCCQRRIFIAALAAEGRQFSNCTTTG